MPTKWLIVLITVNAVAGQLLLKRALIALGGRAALSTVAKFFLAHPGYTRPSQFKGWATFCG
jgi:hypothetical protein